MSNLTFQCSCQIGLLKTSSSFFWKKENQRWKLHNLDYGFGTVCIGSDISCCNTEHIQVLLSLALPPSQTRDKKSTKISPQIFVQDIIFWVITCSVFFLWSFHATCIFWSFVYSLFMSRKSDTKIWLNLRVHRFYWFCQYFVLKNVVTYSEENLC